jgi:hypothetical protein
MIRPAKSLLSLIPLRLAAATVFGISCSPTSGAPEGGTGGTGSTTGGFTGNTGGFSNTTGGFSNTTGGFSNTTGGFSNTTGGTTTTTGGTTTTTTGGTTTTTTGGTVTATGGTTTSTGGTVTATGGTATATGGSGGGSTCAGYDGTVSTSSKIFMNGFGKSTTGSWQGYAYTYTYGTGAVIKPGSSTTMSCFNGDKLCANGSVPADDGAGVGVGWNIVQMSGTSTTGAMALTGSVKITIAGAKEKMRVSLGPATGDEYCYTLTAADATMAATGLTIPVANFKQYCYDSAKAVAYSTGMIKAIQVAVPGGKADGAKTFDFCVVDVEPG